MQPTCLKGNFDFEEKAFTISLHSLDPRLSQRLSYVENEGQVNVTWLVIMCLRTLRKDRLTESCK